MELAATGSSSASKNTSKDKVKDNGLVHALTTSTIDSWLNSV